MFAVMPVNAVPTRRPPWERPLPHHEPPPAHPDRQETGGLPVIDLEPLPVEEEETMSMTAPARAAGFPTGLILDIRA